MLRHVGRLVNQQLVKDLEKRARRMNAEMFKFESN
jgi:hypothetical protein